MIIRILAWIVFCFAMAVMGAEALVFVESGRYHPLTLGAVWQNFHMLSYIRTEEMVRALLSPKLWDPLLVAVLNCPTWALLAGSAFVLWAGPRRHR